MSIHCVCASVRKETVEKVNIRQRGRNILGARPGSEHETKKRKKNVNLAFSKEDSITDASDYNRVGDSSDNSTGIGTAETGATVGAGTNAKGAAGKRCSDATSAGSPKRAKSF